MTLSPQARIESILFYINRPVSVADLAVYADMDEVEVREALHSLAESLDSRGIVLVEHAGTYSLATHPESSQSIEKIARDELNTELSQASLETLAIVLYKAPVTRKEIEYIRGVNVSYSLRLLLVRGLIEKIPSKLDERIFLYAPTVDALKYLGITHITELPGYTELVGKLDVRSKQEITE